MVSDHLQEAVDQQPTVDKAAEAYKGPKPARHIKRKRTPERQAQIEREREERRLECEARARALRDKRAGAQAAAQSAVLVANHLRAGNAPPSEQLVMADPEVLASEIRALLGMDRPYTASEVEQPWTHEAAAAAPKLPIGRPSEYTRQEGDIICQWIADGNSLNTYCQKTGRRPSTIYRWMSGNSAEAAEFRQKYAHAHEDRADTLVDQMLAISDNLPNTVSLEQVKRAELQINTRRWCAERLRPTRWGLQQSVGPSQPITFNIGIARASEPEQRITGAERITVDMGSAVAQPTQQLAVPSDTER